MVEEYLNVLHDVQSDLLTWYYDRVALEKLQSYITGYTRSTTEMDKNLLELFSQVWFIADKRIRDLR